MEIKIEIKDRLDSPNVDFTEAIILSQFDYDTSIPSFIIPYEETEKDAEKEFFPLTERIPEIKKIRRE